MSELSARGRRLLEQYKAAESIPPAGRARLLERLIEADARGALPRFQVKDTFPVVPKVTWGERAWASPIGKPLIASAFLSLPVLAALGASHFSKRVARSTLPVPTQVAPFVVVPTPTEIVSSEPSSSGPPARVVEPAAPADFAQHRTRAPSPSKSGIVPTSRAEATIDGEMLILNEAQSANQAGDSRRALRLLDEYAVRFPSGRLADVRAVARLVALCNLGKVSLEQKEAERFRAKYPNSPFNERVRGICAPKTEP